MYFDFAFHSSTLQLAYAYHRGHIQHSLYQHQLYSHSMKAHCQNYPNKWNQFNPSHTFIIFESKTQIEMINTKFKKSSPLSDKQITLKLTTQKSCEMGAIQYLRDNCHTKKQIFRFLASKGYEEQDSVTIELKIQHERHNHSLF